MENKVKTDMGCKGVIVQDTYRNELYRHRSQKEAARHTGISQAHISLLLNGKRNNNTKYKFMYQNKELGNERT